MRTDRQTDGQTDGPIQAQTYRETEKQRERLNIYSSTVSTKLITPSLILLVADILCQFTYVAFAAGL